jgi:biopolymer transport protein ExbB
VKRRVFCLSAVFFLTAAILLSSVLSAFAWWDDKWAHRRKITFDTSASGANIAETLTDAPVLVRLHSGNFTFANAKEDGADIRFVGGDDKVPLKFHKELYDPALEIGLFWVRVPRIAGSSNADSVWVYYGNKTAVPGEEHGGTYEVNRVLVYHFDEPDGAPKDATAYGNHASKFEGGSRSQGVIGNGAVLGGAGERIVVPRSPSLNFSGGMTFSAWVKPSGPQSDACLFSWEDGGRKIRFALDESGLNLQVAAGETGAEPSKPSLNLKSDAPLAPDSWHLVAFTMKPSDRAVLFVDGAEVSSTPLSVPIPELSTDIVIGAATAGDHPFAGGIDEVRMARIALTPGSMRAAFLGEGTDASLCTISEEESGEKGSADAGYLGTIARNITVDGWAVIGCLIVFGILSVGVFVKKLLMVLVNNKTNDAFLEQFQDATDLLSLDRSGSTTEEEEDSEFYGSSIYEVYSEGVRELRKWLAKAPAAAGGRKILSPLAMRSFNAAIERAYIRETKRLNSLLVILSMAIAGAPFLGLLGTVWGVMNTFAAMAEAGEANLTAIAPGIASALAATVSGLLVAIPALFAYNYLVTQVKTITADVSLFMDELLMKVEGSYGDSQ